MSNKNTNTRYVSDFDFGDETNDNPNESHETENEEGLDLKNQERQENIINQSGLVMTKNDGISINSLTIIGQIEGHYLLPSNSKTTKYEHIIPHLVAIEENPDVHGLLIILNTVGGDVEAGLAIAEMIASMKKPTVSLVLGGAHSIGMPLAVSARKSYIVPSATITVHPVRMNGLVIGVPQSFEYFAKMQERINKFIVSNSNITDKTLRDFMFNTGEIAADVGSIIDGEMAKQCGLINKIGGLSDALSELKAMCRERQRNKKRSKKK